MAKINEAQWKALSDAEWFGALPEPVRRKIVDSARERVLREGECLFRRGDAGNGWFAVLEGTMRISGTSREGRAALLTMLEPGYWFGEMSLLDGGPRTHDAYAHVPTRLLKVAPSDFEDLLAGSPELARELLRMKCLQHRTLMAMFESSMIQTFEAQLAGRLATLARAIGSPIGQAGGVELHLSQDLMAQLVGSSRARVNQVLKVWEAQGLVAHRYGRVVLLDVAALAKMAAE
jgi:CRP/FNR family transcriptional regulator, cyclic AMP receptor protein